MKKKSVALYCDSGHTWTFNVFAVCENDICQIWVLAHYLIAKLFLLTLQLAKGHFAGAWFVENQVFLVEDKDVGSTRPRHVAVKVDVTTRERYPFEPGKFTHQHFFEIFS